LTTIKFKTFQGYSRLSRSCKDLELYAQYDHPSNTATVLLRSPKNSYFCSSKVLKICFTTDLQCTHTCLMRGSWSSCK